MWCSLLLYSAFGYFSVQRLNMHGHIGAVNRRLRTVLDDRGVVLFSSDRERKRIPVLPVTASDVLLETVALPAHENQELAGLGRESEVADSTRLQQQQLWADVQNPGDQSGSFQRVVTGARFAQRERPVVQGTRLHGTEEKRESFVERADLLNRPLRTRTAGGVGAVS